MVFFKVILLLLLGGLLVGLFFLLRALVTPPSGIYEFEDELEADDPYWETLDRLPAGYTEDDREELEAMR